MTDHSHLGVDPASRLAALATGTSVDQALAFYDSLTPATIEAVLGRWRGSGLPTGHPLDGLLEAYGWYGKRFDGPDEAHPLVFEDRRGLFEVDPAGLPVVWLARLGARLSDGRIAGVVARMLRLRRTARATARLRMVEHRGVVTATMIYDALPVNDHLRVVDADTLLGVMDVRGTDEPFFFVLRREPG